MFGLVGLDVIWQCREIGYVIAWSKKRFNFVVIAIFRVPDSSRLYCIFTKVTPNLT
jgi:hypothetical protein